MQNKSNINYLAEKKTYYNKILNYLNISDFNKENNTNNYSDNIKEKQIKNIIFLSIKKIKEKKIKYFKSYLNHFYQKYENIKNETNYDISISKLYEESKKDELYSFYQNIYNEIANNKFDLPDFNNSKITFEDIKILIINLYDKHFNNF